MTELVAFKDNRELIESEFIFRIVDNGGATCDRYTVIFSDGDYLGLSAYPSSPQGFSQWGEGIDVSGVAERVEAGEEIDMNALNLPAGHLDHIRARLNEAWADFLANVEERKGGAVAINRDKAMVNEGVYNSGGVGIYCAGKGFCVRLDGDDASEDRGPYDNAADALRATLPDPYACAGPEYHSPCDMTSNEPDPDYPAALIKLERRIGAKDAGYEVTQLAYGGAGLGPYWEIKTPDGQIVANALDFSAGEVDAWNVAGDHWAAE